MQPEFCTNSEDWRAKVEMAPWFFFHVPKMSRTKDLALVAWQQVSYVLARQRVGFVPEAYFEKGEWEHFIDLLCDGNISPYLLVSENRQSWFDVVHLIDSHMAISGVIMTNEFLPEIN